MEKSREHKINVLDDNEAVVVHVTKWKIQYYWIHKFSLADSCTMRPLILLFNVNLDLLIYLRVPTSSVKKTNDIMATKWLANSLFVRQARLSVYTLQISKLKSLKKNDSN